MRLSGLQSQSLAEYWSSDHLKCRKVELGQVKRLIAAVGQSKNQRPAEASLGELVESVES